MIGGIQMDLLSIRALLRTKSIYETPLRVTYYARVSSESDEQLNSLSNQVAYYSNFIKEKKAWDYVEGYIDEDISGISTKKRDAFNRMIADAQEDKFDLIITKEISRFARNTLDSIKFTRDLLACDVGVLFQNDGLCTFDEDSELRLSIMSSIAQDELRKLSSRVKFGHQQAIRSHVVLGNSRIFGYRKDNKHLVIDSEEAVMVRELYELYATDQYSMKQIETIFWERGYRNHNGKRIAHTTMSGMISNPKYKGYYVGNKVKVVDMFTKKQKFLPPEEWVMFKDETGELVPAIVTEELWDAANAILRRRSEDVKNRQGVCNHANLLTGKMYCAACGAAYYRREFRSRVTGAVNSKWVCSGKIKGGADSCPSFPIYEDEIKPILYEAFRETEADVEAIIRQYTEMFREIASADDIGEQIASAKARLEIIQKKKNKLLEYNVTGQISDREYMEMSRACERERAEQEETLHELEEQLLSQDEFRKRMNDIENALRTAQAEATTGLITPEFVNKYIDKIVVTPVDEATAQLTIRIFTGETTEKYLQKLESRAGHTFKKMVESYENSIK